MSVDSQKTVNLNPVLDKLTNDVTLFGGSMLLFPNVAIGKIWVQGTLSEKENFLQTFWQEQEVFVNRGILFDGADPVQVKYRHLNHEEFSHNIQVTNWAKGPLDVTVRLYIAPKSDHSGKVIPFSRQRLMFIELDNYPTTINPGVQVLRRLSSESSIILPTSSMVNNLACAPSSPYYLAGDRAARGCGWPYHMLVPKGRTDGMIFTYFVMITKGGGYNEYANRTAYRYCGLLNKKYPDRESLGFPFDRTVSGSVSAIQDFASTSNMMTAEVVIQHRDLLVPSNDTEQSCSY